MLEYLWVGMKAELRENQMAACLVVRSDYWRVGQKAEKLVQYWAALWVEKSDNS